MNIINNWLLDNKKLYYGSHTLNFGYNKTTYAGFTFYKLRSIIIYIYLKYKKYRLKCPYT